MPRREGSVDGPSTQWQHPIGMKKIPEDRTTVNGRAFFDSGMVIYVKVWKTSRAVKVIVVVYKLTLQGWYY